jgi:hypothetical protein
MGQHLSNAAWLGIIVNNSTHRGFNATRYYSDHCTESSPAHFSGDLATATRRNPQRFARMALHIPAGANPIYLNAILSSLAHGEPPQHLREDEKHLWKSPSLEILEPVIDRALERPGIQCANALCRILRVHNDLGWSSSTIQAVVDLALSEGPRDSSVVVPTSQTDQGLPSVDNLEQRAINCLRGEAAETIEALLWSDVGRLPILQPAIDQLVTDPDPAVRVAVIGACGPVWNADKELSSRWFVQACSHEDDRVMACRDSRHLMPFIARSHPAVASAIIRRMIDSGHPETAAAGAAHATMLWLSRNEMGEEVALCRAGSSERRRGVALSASDLARNEEYSRKALELLTPLLDDEDEKVRKNCDRIFHMGNILEREEIRPFLESYVRSRCFLGNQWVLLHAFALHAGSLLPLTDLLMSLIDVCAGPLLNESRDPSTRTAHQVSELGPLLLRLYEQTKDNRASGTHQRCLNAWDLMLERRVGMTRELMKSIDR